MGGEATVLDKHGQTQVVIASEPIAVNHKLALENLSAGDLVIKYGRAIGQATKPIGVGQWVHIHNLDSLRGRKPKN